MSPRGCAFGKCNDPHCYFCVVMPQRFPPVVRCPTVLDVGGRKKHVACRFVLGHPGPCKPSSKQIVEEPTEDAWWNR